MKTDHPISIIRKPGAHPEFWSFYVGRKDQAVECAKDLLEDLREQGFTKAKVFLHGKKINVRRKKDGDA